jgi:hypothetical protein
MKIVITVEVPDGAAVAVGTSESEPAAKAPRGKAKAVTESAPPAAPAPTTVATAPAAAPPPAAEAPTPPSLTALNAKVSVLAGLDRDAAVKILVAHGAAKLKTSTSQLKPEVYQVVLDETEEAIDKINAAATQVSNSGSLV